MRNLKQNFVRLLVAIIFISITSCGGGGKNIETVKLIPVKIGKDFQYIDAEGKIIINPQFSEATVFRNGLALVKTSGDKPQWGFIGEDGKYAIIANYKSATVFSDNLAWVVSENAAPSCINTKGELKFTMQNAEHVRQFSEGLAAFDEVNEKGEEKWGFVDKDGKVKINPQFSSVGDFNNDKCAVRNSDGKWGYIDKEGKLLINNQFDYAESFINGKAVVKSGGKAGLIDANGKYLINPQFSEMQNDGDLFLVNQDGKYGWTDKDGKIIINPQFSRAFPFTGSDLAAVQSGKSYGFIDKEGKIMINPQFDMALPFNGKLALVVSSGKIGFIDNKGKYVINPQFDDVAIDLVQYFQTGGSIFNLVNTDFFNVGVITSRIKVDAPEGLNYNTTASDILTKFKKSESEFGEYETYHKIISDEKISNDARVDFFIMGNLYNDVQDGFFSRKVFNGVAKPIGFAYIIRLTGKGYGKEEAVKTAFEQSLTGYSIDESKSSANAVTYTNRVQNVKISISSNNIEILIIPINATSTLLTPAVADTTVRVVN